MDYIFKESLTHSVPENNLAVSASTLCNAISKRSVFTRAGQITAMAATWHATRAKGYNRVFPA